VHGGTGIDMLQPRKFDEHVYNAVPRAERGHDVAAPPPTSPDDIDIVAGGMGALALDDRVSVTNPAGTNSMRGADHEQVLWRVVMEMRVEVTADEYVCRSAAARGCRRRAGAGA
jgi:hypothetical protein